MSENAFLRVKNIFKPLTLKKAAAAADVAILSENPFSFCLSKSFSNSFLTNIFLHSVVVVCDDIVCAWVPVCHSLAICKNTKFPHFQSSTTKAKRLRWRWCCYEEGWKSPFHYPQVHSIFFPIYLLSYHLLNWIAVHLAVEAAAAIFYAF